MTLCTRYSLRVSSKLALQITEFKAFLVVVKMFSCFGNFASLKVPFNAHHQTPTKIIFKNLTFIAKMQNSTVYLIANLFNLCCVASR